MDAAQALADLTEISTQIQAALIADEKGAVLASTFADDAMAGQAARSALDLLAAAEDAGRNGTVRLTQILAATHAGSVFVVRGDDRIVTAVTGPEPTVGLVFYDLKTCLRISAAEQPEKPKRTRKKKAEEKSADE
jgi:predicted regulator of Ras-like GTPase activity (Roadblock/LC7/MglB family)